MLGRGRAPQPQAIAQGADRTRRRVGVHDRPLPSRGGGGGAPRSPVHLPGARSRRNRRRSSRSQASCGTASSRRRPSSAIRSGSWKPPNRRPACASTNSISFRSAEFSSRQPQGRLGERQGARRGLPPRSHSARRLRTASVKRSRIRRGFALLKRVLENAVQRRSRRPDVVRFKLDDRVLPTVA